MCVHSHADAPESSGAFFHDIGTGKCRKQAGRPRNALRASQAVHATDVMVNLPHRLVQKKPEGLFCYELAIFSCEFFIGIA
uniref:Uncharacterized protein n=1 Tax=Escherichia coli TaxID=562 RepID=A0A172CBV5_ECOLX|nr:hypothetical protein [Escherichia coli]AVA18153.1 hypothetical protein [Escherichia coli]AVA18171.1 hypothetical protein [Escherichia coli]